MSKPIESNILTDTEYAALGQFKDKISDIIANLCEYRRQDVWLVQWLRARDLDVQRAVFMIRKHMVLRRGYLIGILTWKVPPLLDKHFSVKVGGIDKHGTLIAIIPFGKADYRQIVSYGLKQDVIRYVAQFFEQACAILKHNSTNDRVCTQMTLILDCKGFQLQQMTYKENVHLFNEFIHLLQDNYPEILKNAFVVNAPQIFETLFTILKPPLSMRTRDKIQIYGSNPTHWRSIILEYIDPDLLPSEYGGSNTTCRDYKVAYGLDWFPVHPTLPENEMIPVTVQAGKKYSVKFTLSKGSKLSWNFRTTDYDIGFSALCPFESVTGATGPITPTGEQELFHCSYVDSHLHLQKGCMVAEKSGSYTLVFDNSSSECRSKELFYVTRVYTP